MYEFGKLLHLQNYYLNPYSIPPLLVGIVALLLGLFIYYSNARTQINRCFFYYCLSVFIWLGGQAFVLSSLRYEHILFWSHVFFSAIIFAPATIYHLSAVITQKYSNQKFLIKIVYGIAFLLMVLIWNPYFFQGIERNEYGFYPKAGILNHTLVIFMVSCFFISLVNLIYFHFFEADSSQRRQTRFFMLSFLVLQFSAVDIFASFDQHIFPAGYAVILGFLLSITFFKMRKIYQSENERSRILQEQLEKKALEVSNIVEELRKTQLKLLESGRTSALTSLGAGILHQISQPITAIHGFIKFLKKEVSPDYEFYRPICLIEEQSENLKQMLSDLMNLVRHREIKKENVNLNDIIKRCMNLLSDELAMRQIDWNLKLDSALPVIYADGILFQQIFMNIVINAVEALETLKKHEKKEIVIKTRYVSQTDDVIISFQDSGPGIMGKDQPRVFEPFFSTKTNAAGIGLSLCRDIIAEHEGNIQVKSKPDKGAEFIIRLPCIQEKSGVQEIKS